MREKIRKRVETLRNLMTIFVPLTVLDTHEDLIITSRIKPYTDIQTVQEKHDDIRAICYTTVLLKAIDVSNKFSPETVIKKHGVKHGRK